ncbi:hypothetical protein HMPREF0765_4004 [Sphingobacterium spiritivorum ATCC 33300]|uniref:KilA-N DNA-binding domain-containing protein n=1 Tax=Sphingobacterium spiritivorum ATCC 33300 TaxID=525372 RepID=C2G348_SPHSI|nr:ORF6N domain-containing protein [Sphingobacterium spiritivorum]EEI90417.1 hypothetical protein HMPREF0765_4004 [Sphingobacterium spiritivorum ATCC 33300]QQS95289.1 ORF6N domain-containing protein [Sphingobacterium spiritivorum]
MNRKENIQNVLSDEVLIDKIYLIRGQRIILDRDLAQLYNVEIQTGFPKILSLKYLIQS